MRKPALFIVLALSLLCAFAAGYYYRAAHMPASAELEDYALTDVLEDIGYVHYLAKGDFEAMRSMLDISLNGHLSRVRRHSGAVADPQFDAARTRTLNAVAAIWDRYPPFQSPQWRESEVNASWWPEWSEGLKQNQALIQEAKAKCAATPALNCKAQPPATRLPAEAK